MLAFLASPILYKGIRTYKFELRLIKKTYVRFKDSVDYYSKLIFLSSMQVYIHDVCNQCLDFLYLIRKNIHKNILLNIY